MSFNRKPKGTNGQFNFRVCLLAIGFKKENFAKEKTDMDEKNGKKNCFPLEL